MKNFSNGKYLNIPRHFINIVNKTFLFLPFGKDANVIFRDNFLTLYK